jgi:hypothetical protein
MGQCLEYIKSSPDLFMIMLEILVAKQALPKEVLPSTCAVPIYISWVSKALRAPPAAHSSAITRENLKPRAFLAPRCHLP